MPDKCALRTVHFKIFTSFIIKWQTSKGMSGKGTRNGYIYFPQALIVTFPSPRQINPLYRFPSQNTILIYSL